MAKSPNNLDFLKTELATHGLSVLGCLRLSETQCAKGQEFFNGQSAILIGNAGAEMWEHFSRSAEFRDSLDNPMNRWTKRVVSNLINDFECEVRYPFDEPYWPFQRIAKDAMRIESSPLGLLIDTEYGLWHAFRAIIIVNLNNSLFNDVERQIQHVKELIHPCDACVEKPCLSACPVGAFTDSGLNTKDCFIHLDAANEPDCMSAGCQARNACPIGREYKYHNDQIGFHMKSYRGL